MLYRLDLKQNPRNLRFGGSMYSSDDDQVNTHLPRCIGGLSLDMWVVPSSYQLILILDLFIQANSTIVNQIKRIILV